MDKPHTALPWKIGRLHKENDRDRMIIAFDGFMAEIVSVGSASGMPEEVEANAAFIVRACNSHYDLLKVCHDAKDEVLPLCGAIPHLNRLWDNLFAAIAKAEGV